MAKDKEKADFEIQPTPVDLRNLFKREKSVIVRTVSGDKKIKIVLPKLTPDDFDEMSNASDYLNDIIEELDEDYNSDEDDFIEDNEDLDDDENSDDEDE